MKQGREEECNGSMGLSSAPFDQRAQATGRKEGWKERWPAAAPKAGRIERPYLTRPTIYRVLRRDHIKSETLTPSLMFLLHCLHTR